jgi:hypothetical protein
MIANQKYAFKSEKYYLQRRFGNLPSQIHHSNATITPPITAAIMENVRQLLAAVIKGSASEGS